MQQSSALIVLSGFPGTGKSVVADMLSSNFGLAVFSKDRLEASIVRSELASVTDKRLGFSGYEILTECALAMLTTGNSVVLDSVCGRESIRAGWRAMAASFSADFFVIECVCSDEELHRRRLQSRVRQIPGWPELDWEDVVRVKSYFEPWTEDRLVLDSRDSFQINNAKLLMHFGDRFVIR